MNRKNYEIASLPAEIIIGRQTETGVLDIRIDCTGWLTFWPKLSLSIWVTPPGGSAAYPATTHMEGNVIVWDVNNSDTAVAGSGTMEIVGLAAGQKKLSAVTKTRVERTTTSTTTTPPAGAQAWVDDVLQAAADAENYAQQAAKSAEEAKQNAGGGVADSVAWSNVTGKPSTYPPATHTHTEYLGVNDTAANAKQLNGKSADQYALKTDTVEDSAKLGGVVASEYALKQDLKWKNIGASAGSAVVVPDCEEVMLYVTATDKTTYAFNSVILPYFAFEGSYIPMRIFIRGGYATITCAHGNVTLTAVILDGTDVTQTSKVDVYAR